MPRSLHEKYIITKTDGTPVDPKADYFVLRLDTDPCARIAALAYADAVEEENFDLAERLRNRVHEWNLRDFHRG